MDKVIYIRWLDSIHDSGWQSPKEYEFKREELEHETVGFLFRETEYSYAVAESKSIDHRVIDSVIEIPKCSILYTCYLDFPDETPKVKDIQRQARKVSKRQIKKET